MIEGKELIMEPGGRKQAYGTRLIRFLGPTTVEYRILLSDLDHGERTIAYYLHLLLLPDFSWLKDGKGDKEQVEDRGIWRYGIGVLGPLLGLHA